MKNKCVTVFFSFMLVLQTTVVFAGQLPSSLEQYQEAVQTTLADEKNDEVKEYLHSCLSVADHLNGLEASDSRVSAAFTALVQQHLAADGKLTAQTS